MIDVTRPVAKFLSLQALLQWVYIDSFDVLQYYIEVLVGYSKRGDITRKPFAEVDLNGRSLLREILDENFIVILIRRIGQHMMLRLGKGRVVYRCRPIGDLTSHIPSLSLIADDIKFLVVGVAIADVGEVVDILHVDDESVSARVVDRSGLQEGDIFEGRRVLPGDVQLVLLVDLRLLQLVLHGLL
jgi:hypothetical protein